MFLCCQVKLSKAKYRAVSKNLHQFRIILLTCPPKNELKSYTKAGHGRHVIPGTLDMEMRGSQFEVRPRKMLVRLHLNKQTRYGSSHYNPSYREGISRRILVQGWAKQQCTRPYLKNN
jgi:hypothetical protein